MPLEGLSPVHLLLILVIIAIPVVVLVVLLRAATGARRPDPSAILAVRLARGEITREDFDTAMRALGQTGPTTWRRSDQDPPPGG